MQLGFEPGCLFRIESGVVLQDATVGADVGIGVEKDFYLRLGKDDRADVAPFHDHAAVDAHFALPGDHPFAHRRMHREARGGVGHIALANAGRHVAAIQQNAIVHRGRNQFDARAIGQRDHRRFAIEGASLLECFKAQSAIHGAALQVDVAELACQARGDGALAGSGRAVDGDDQLPALG